MNNALAADSLPNILELSAEARKKLMREEFAKTSRFQKEFGADNKELSCGKHAEILRNEIARILDFKGVVVKGKAEEWHKNLSEDLKEYNFNDGVNKISTFLYDTDDEFLRSYHAFLKDCVQHYFPYPFYFQATPTIRIQTPKGKNNDHYPRYHTDINYGHPPQEINIWLPLTEPVAPVNHGFRRTDVENSRKILEQFDYDFGPFIERAVNDKPFNHKINEVASQVTTPFGKMSAFDSRSIHTGEPLEDHTRISMDIRIIPVADFNTLPVEYQGVGRRKIRYVPGQAYHNLSSEKL